MAKPKFITDREELNARLMKQYELGREQEETLRVRERALFDRLDPASVHADRDLVLRLARDRAGMAADALGQIDRESVVGHSRRL